ncbi:LysR family transcriptional regulator [Rhodovulum sulfidophilum]|uniref:LysR family transcriptional regulator n=1 Tax=Rhodovulum sulfidophilum TaxID=35806 RepID=A0ABS1RVJ2_RHOSU|nr:LysR family transcriptional regulator [Rhodovulum sulfidophilum]MBL3610090.1 LysR family transcriptional regulator [Rhodovulum sulfidophilum]MCE8455872.1 LysR family transcriptional regulator [Rhodovulum sulfidophilum]
MEFRTLRVFVEVVRAGGFSAAAGRVHATQSTISKAVRQLEDEIGMPLLIRGPAGIALTAAGEIVFQRAQTLLAGRETLKTELQELAGLKRGLLRIGLPPIGSSELFAPVFTLYRRRYPGVDIKLVEHGSDRLEELLRASEIDLAASLLPVSEEFDWLAMRRDPLVALMATDAPLAQVPGPLTLADLRTMPFILFDSGFALNRIIRAACARHGFEPEVTARSSQIDFIIRLAAAGLGVAFLPRLIARARVHVPVAQVPLDEPGTDWAMATLWRRGAYLPQAARAWLDIAAGDPAQTATDREPD